MKEKNGCLKSTVNIYSENPVFKEGYLPASFF